MRNSYLGQAWLVIVLCVAFGALLAGVDVTLGPKIAANMEADSQSMVPVLVLSPAEFKEYQPGQLEISRQNWTFQSDGRPINYVIYKAVAVSDNRIKGWVVKGSGKGWENMDLLVALSPDAARLLNFSALKQNETPGLGSKMIEPKWRKHFENLDATQPVQVVKDRPPVQGHSEVPALTGATITSQGVADVINKITSQVGPELARQAANHAAMEAK